MKKLINRFTATFTITVLVMILVNFVIQRRLAVTYPFIATTLAALLIALSAALSITLFRLQKINAILAVVLGLIPLMAIPLILRRLYGLVIFRFSFVLLIAFALCALAYAIAVIVVAGRYKKEARELNDLLK